MADLVAYIRKDHIDVMNLRSSERAAGSAAFTSARLLIGHFPVAETLLGELMKKLGTGGFLSSQPRLVIQPLEMTDGGLCVIEERAFIELGRAAGARVSKVYVGETLSKEAAAHLLDDAA